MIPINLPKGFQIKDVEIVDGTHIGRGAFGFVFKAWKPLVRNYYAVKIFYPLILEGVDESERENAFEKTLAYFATEQEILVECKHRNIVQIEDFGSLEDANGTLFPYYMMEFIPHNLQGNRYGLEKAISFTAQVCDALSFLHGRGVIHRDIKPGNLLLKDGDMIKVADFGISKLVTETSKAHAFTEIGTPPYRPPEQNTGQGLDATADIYATAKTLFSLITGTVPRKGQITALPALSGNGDQSIKLLEILRSATSKETADRGYKNAEDFKDALLSLNHDKGISGVAGPSKKGSKTKSDSKTPVVVPTILETARKLPIKTFAAVLAAVAIVVVGYLRFPELQDRAFEIWQQITAKTQNEQVEFSPDPAQARQHFEQGLRWFDTQKWASAKTELEEAVRNDPTNAEYHAYLGLVYAELSEGENAISAWEETVRLNPENVDHLVNLGKVYAQFGKSEQAIEAWERALAKRPDDEVVKVLIRQERKGTVQSMK